MSKFDIRRASKDQLDRMNIDIKNGKSGRKYTVHQSGGLDFILVEEGVESKSIDQEQLFRGVSAMSKEKTEIKERATKHETSIPAERVDNETPLEFNFGPL